MSLIGTKFLETEAERTVISNFEVLNAKILVIKRCEYKRKIEDERNIFKSEIDYIDKIISFL